MSKSKYGMMSGVAFLVAVACCCVKANADQLVLAEGGNAIAQIIVPTTPTSFEQQAGQELKHYLSRITGAEFSVVRQAIPDGPALIVGDTQRGRSLGLDTDKTSAGGVVIRRVANRVYILGDGKAGPLMAAYWFLENIAGVRWFNDFGEEYVPNESKLVIGEIHHVEPQAFKCRDVYNPMAGIINGQASKSRNMFRNGVNGTTNTRYGEFAYYYSGCHTFYHYIKPEIYFDKHPEYFSLLKGKRACKGRTQLCFSNPGLRQELTRLVLAKMAENKKAANGLNIYSISANDFPGPLCECSACQAMVKKYKTNGGPLFDYMVELAKEVHRDFPEFWLHTLAYRRRQTEAPPVGLRIPDNLIIVFAPADNDLAQPLDGPANRETFRNLIRWSKICKNLWVWYYPEPYGPFACLPFDNIHDFAWDMKICRRLGVSGVFVENDAANAYFFNLSDLHQWMIKKVLQNPDADLEALVKDFTDKYYGAAGQYIREYFYMLHRSAKRNRSNIYLSPSRRSYEYLTCTMIKEADALFEKAEKSVEDSKVLLRRVQRARLSLYLSQIMFADDLGRQDEVQRIIEQVTRIHQDTLDERIFPQYHGRYANRLKSLLELQRGFCDKSAKKVSLCGKRKKDYAEYTGRDLCVPGSKKNMIDANARAGIAVTAKLSKSDAAIPIGIYDTNAAEYIMNTSLSKPPISSEYQLVKIGACKIGPNCVLWITNGWQITARLEGLAASRKYDVYVSTKSVTTDKIAVDRVVVIPTGTAKLVCK